MSCCCSSPVADLVSVDGRLVGDLQMSFLDLIASLEDEVESQGGMGDLEESLFQDSKGLLRLALEKAAQAKADGCEPNCPVCGARLERIARGREKTIRSRFGPVRIVRLHGRCRGCGKWFYPADHVLGLTGEGKASPGMQEAASLLVSKMPVEEAAEALERLTGVSVCPATLDRDARGQGERAKQARDAMDEQALDTQGRWDVAREVKESLPADPFTLVIMVDAWMIRERDEWGRSEALRKKGREPERWHWVYAATVFRLNERVAKPGGRRMIASRGYVSTREGCEALSRQVYAEAVRQGLLHARDVLVVADGAAWIWNIAEERFPWARKRLDFYHASEHLWDLANALYGKGTQEARKWAKPLARQLRHGGSARVIKTLEDLCARVEESKRPQVEREHKYFASHKDRLDYKAGAARDEPIGSGAMESTCRQYQCRFKRPGQFWTRDGDEALMALSTFWRNGRWRLLFPHIRCQNASQN